VQHDVLLLAVDGQVGDVICASESKSQRSSGVSWKCQAYSPVSAFTATIELV
jgi:hypothetical protein